MFKTRSFIQAFISTRLLYNNLNSNLHRNVHIIPSQYQNKEWRNACIWYKNGLACEKYQRNLVEKIIQTSCLKTHDRINLRNLELKHLTSYKNDVNGFDWSENFDGKVILNNNIYYFNFKMICSDGGFQSRSSRENYWFMDAQMKYLELTNNKNIYFINILDGYVNNNNLEKYKSLIELYFINKNNVYIGDLFEFNNWWCKHLDIC